MFFYVYAEAGVLKQFLILYSQCMTFAGSADVLNIIFPRPLQIANCK